jgi:hypothetical protein
MSFPAGHVLVVIGLEWSWFWALKSALSDSLVPIHFFLNENITDDEGFKESSFRYYGAQFPNPGPGSHISPSNITRRHPVFPVHEIRPEQYEALLT